jgi:hypothetical protein
MSSIYIVEPFCFKNKETVDLLQNDLHAWVIWNKLSIQLKTDLH